MPKKLVPYSQYERSTAKKLGTEFEAPGGNWFEEIYTTILKSERIELQST